jgi:hypothetical protein
MLLQADGDLQIAPGETVRVTVTATKTHYLAIFGTLLQSQWEVVQPVRQVGPDTVTEIRTFVGPGGGREAFAISCDFVRDGAGNFNAEAEYTIEVVGNGGSFSVEKHIFPVPPFPVNRPFTFEVHP